ncbi:MAG: imidazoleglycerol-phosphate dehydratase HisB [Clostridium sp.]
MTINSRSSSLKRTTKETDIYVEINLNETGNSKINTGVGFFDHMLNLLSFHGGFALNIEAKGDLEVCDHHMVEDVGIAMGQVFKEALGDKKGIRRYGTSYVPMDEALCFVTLDISGRSFLVFDGDFKRESIGNFSTEMVKEFFRAFAFNAGVTLHSKVMYGENDHHKIEGLFKALGRALREAIEVVGEELPSTKGVI